MLRLLCVALIFLVSDGSWLVQSMKQGREKGLTRPEATLFPLSHILCLELGHMAIPSCKGV